MKNVEVHIAQVQLRHAYLRELDDTKGPQHFRTLELAAIAWVLAELGSLYPVESFAAQQYTTALIGRRRANKGLSNE